MRKVSAILLAAGKGERAQGLKPMLPWRGEDFLTTTYRALEDCGELNEIIVVTGHRRDALSSTLMWLGAREVYNPRFAEGMLTSIQKGIESLTAGWDGVMVALVDQPQLLPEDYRLLVREFRRSPQTLLRPTCDGQPGNPAILHRSFAAEILNEGAGDRGCQFLFQRHPRDVVEVPLTERCLVDFDTVQDLEIHENRALL